ncbi:hypothetical protein [Actinokineospora enzanensis]|uniref:hypothetical protein n=1 Tax=Actinokineospora enzanensis TaxID=155975 RepID=UPI000369F79E|nr:hypothetical protein [Actinokineospora enzanensis]
MLLEMVNTLRADGPPDRPARHQAILLLWAIGRAARDEPRLVRWSQARSCLRDLVAALDPSGDHEDVPFVALAQTAWWEETSADPDPLGGLVDRVHTRMATDPEARAQVVGALLRRFFPAGDAAEALAMTGLDGVESAEPPEHPDVADARRLVDLAAGRRRRPAFGLSSGERRAIDRRALRAAAEHLTAQGYAVADVGAVQPYDFDATRGDEQVVVLVKGTTSAGAQVVLTAEEVALARLDAMLVVVGGIEIDHAAPAPRAVGGTVRVIHPWVVAEDRLSPLAYGYVI